ncbi:MAG: precorrin-6A synthase [Gaiellales bacterium]|jgi:precorrin-6A synthase|nr:precorrin-6A synthase [Gaiellales bacterium]
MRRLLLIGIGAGDPEYMTAQAIRALNTVDVFFVVEKGEAKDDLVALRREICERYIERPGYRTVALRDPERDRSSPAYGEAVAAWRHARAQQWASALRSELGEDECGAFLVWGDPSLYDSTLAVIEEILADGALELEHEVVPGISSIHALTARHRIALNRIGRPIVITTGRRLAEGLHDGADDIVVMLDAGCAFRRFAGEPVDIYWGAYLGTPDELLLAGDVGALADEIERVRAAARRRKGWIMDTYLLRRRL